MMEKKLKFVSPEELKKLEWRIFKEEEKTWCAVPVELFDRIQALVEEEDGDDLGVINLCYLVWSLAVACSENPDILKDLKQA